MSSKRKVILNALLFFLVFGVTLGCVFHGEDLSEIWEDLTECDIRWLIPAVVCVFLYIWGESIIIWFLMSSCGIRIKKSICFLFSNIGFFFSCVTPSASGGQPMQIYFMKKENIPVPVSSVILLIVTITYKAVLVVVGLGTLFFAGGFCDRYLGEMIPVFYLGILLNVICVAIMVVLVFHPSLVRNIAYSCLKMLEKIHILKPKKNRLQKLEDSMDSYHDTAGFMKNHVGLVIEVFFITVLQRAALFVVPCFVYRAFGLNRIRWYTILMLQAVVSVSVDMLPLPGGMGISETLFLLIFDPVFGEFLLPGMVLCRGIGYYSELLISALFTVLAVLIFSGKAFRRKKTSA